MADLVGLDLRAIGLMLSQRGPETPVRCGVAGFQAHDGVLAAQTLVLDTEQVLIVGEGKIRMDSEAIDLALRGPLIDVVEYLGRGGTCTDASSSH